MFELTPGVRPLVPSRLRAPLLAAGAVALAVFLATAIEVSGTTSANQLDLAVEGFVDRRAILPGPRAYLLIQPGTPLVVVSVAVAVGLISIVRRDLPFAAFALLVPGISGLAVEVLKPLIGRTFDNGGMAFPSGHTAGATSIGLVLALGLIRLRPWWHRGRSAALMAVVPLAAATTTGFGLVAIGRHYAIDTVGGFCSAFVIGSATALTVDAVTKRVRAVSSRAARRPPASESR
jgi:membrane-associated phospholipid phosphatase